MLEKLQVTKMAKVGGAMPWLSKRMVGSPFSRMGRDF